MDKQKRSYCLIVLSIIVIAILAACGMENAEHAITQIPAKETTFTPSKQVTKTPEPTGTMEPTLAYWATAQEERFAAIDTEREETQAAIFELSTQFPQLCGFNIDRVFPSPNGEWIANDCKYVGNFFRVFQINGNQIWEVPYSAIFEYYPDFIGGVDTIFWSMDGNDLYFVTIPCCPDIDTLGNGDNLYRLDLKTGEWELIIAGSYHFYSFSPDGQQLAYTPNNQTDTDNSIDLHVLDLKTKKEEALHLGSFDQARIISWNQEGTQLVLLAQNGSLYTDDSKYALVVVDLNNKTSQIIIDLTEDWLNVIDWSEDNILTISKSNAIEYYGYYINVSDILFYDLETDVFIVPTTTQ